MPARQRNKKKRIGQAWRFFWALKHTLLNKGLNKNLRLQILKSCVLPTLLYGCQTWSLTTGHQKTLNTCQRKMERKILDFNWRDGVSSKELCRIVNTENVVQRAADLKWKWGGHVVRLPQNRWALIATTWDPYERRRIRGRPRTRWADALKHIAGPLWSRVA